MCLLFIALLGSGSSLAHTPDPSWSGVSAYHSAAKIGRPVNALNEENGDLGSDL